MICLVIGVLMTIEGTDSLSSRVRVCISLNYRSSLSMKIFIDIKENQQCLLDEEYFFLSKCLFSSFNQTTNNNDEDIFIHSSISFFGRIHWNDSRLRLTLIVYAFCLPSTKDLPIMLNCSTRKEKAFVC